MSQVHERGREEKPFPIVGSSTRHFLQMSEMQEIGTALQIIDIVVYLWLNLSTLATIEASRS